MRRITRSYERLVNLGEYSNVTFGSTHSYTFDEDPGSVEYEKKSQALWELCFLFFSL